MSKSYPSDKTILIVVALEDEIHEDLRNVSLVTGVGKINATLILTEYLCNHPEVKVVLNLGTAGSLKHLVGDVVRCTQFIERDMITSKPQGITPGENYLTIEHNPKRFKNLVDSNYICATGDQFLLSESDTEPFRYANVFDMEAYALAKVCERNNIDFLSFKVVSDIIGKNSSEMWSDFLKEGRAILRTKYFDVLDTYNM